MFFNFDRIAGSYNILSIIVFGNSIHKAQLQFLDRIPKDSNVLIIGGGSGRFLKDVLLKCSIKKVLYLEHSAEMIRLSKNAVEGFPERKLVEFRRGNEADIIGGEVFDVVITHCLLNLFGGLQLRSLMYRINSHLKPGGIWIFSDFRISKSNFHKIWQIPLLKTMYLFFRITAGLQNKTLEKFDDLFEQMLLVKMEEEFFYNGMINAAYYYKKEK